MDKEINHHRRIIFIIFSSFFIFISLILGIVLIFFLLTFGHDFKESKCFEAIDSWYKQNNINIAAVSEKRWKQHLECEKNMGFFPWGKEVKFSK